MRTEEKILSALAARLDTVTDARFFREPDGEISVEPGELVIVMTDGDPGEPDVELGITSYTYAHEVSVDCYAAETTGTPLETALDALITAVRAALAGDADLGGLAEDVSALAPEEPEVFRVTGAAPTRGRTVPVVVTYSVPDPLS